MNLVNSIRPSALRLSGMADVLDTACTKPRPSRWPRSTSSQRSSATNSSGASSSGATSRRASVTPTARSTASISPSTRRSTARLSCSPPRASSPSARTRSCSARGTGKSHLAQAIGRAAIQQGYRVIYREAHTLLEELAEATLADTRKDYLTELTRVPLLIIDDLGMRKLPHTAAEDLLELIMRRSGLHRAHFESTGRTKTARRHRRCHGATRPAAASRGSCGPRSWRTKVQTTLRTHDVMK